VRVCVRICSASRHKHNENKDSTFYLIDHGSKASAQRRELPERFFEHAGKGEEAEGVPGWGGVKDDHRILHRLDVPVRFGQVGHE